MLDIEIGGITSQQLAYVEMLRQSGPQYYRPGIIYPAALGHRSPAPPPAYTPKPCRNCGAFPTGARDANCAYCDARLSDAP